ncbi:hypothetical protein [Xanthomonas sacchari]|uniref:hypothetical protein n=1 Tax=Xanthomonas sacchari TaxID=56458 RepID=UPI00225A1D2F|nr:hypothetical protein [Xanthomonas sacchari]MCW0376824.1 hypothetical protein [Xanthomonas sacchari]
MPRSVVSFREQTSGRLTDLLSDEGLVCGQTQGVLAILVGALANYKEEGVELTPTVLICDSIDDVLRRIPSSVKYQIGVAELDQNSARKILKECAVLAAGDWFVYIERAADGYRFGVAASSGGPISVSLTEIIRIRKAGFAIIVRRIAESTVELVGAKGHELSLVFSTVREASNQSADEALQGFSRACAAALEESEEKDKFVLYLSRMITRVLEASHGTILVCFTDGKLDAVDELKESIALSPAMPLYQPFCDFLVSQSGEALLRLQNFESLLRGLVNSDGVVAFSDSGEVIAYRAFFRPGSSQGSEKAPAPQMVIGGARRRAYEGISACIGAVLSCALFRSQDGLTIFRCKE